MKKPILILQMQRMGDLVLTFPLILWLRRRFKGHPIRVVAEPIFFRELLPLSPEASYIPWDQADTLAREDYFLLINLSHRPEAARLAGKLRAEKTIGPMLTPSGATYIPGDWQLYRAGLVHNNRHNRFHWGDLNALDCIGPEVIRATTWPAPEPGKSSGNRVGIFVGASQDEKRPLAPFWAELVDQCILRDLRPILLGGPKDRIMGNKVMSRTKTGCLNLCARFSLPEFIRILSTLDLFITPDTGPMHLAAWAGTRVLNLSMGPVNPWETGPFLPGHHVLQSSDSCVGCWSCTNSIPLHCRTTFQPNHVAALARRIIKAGDKGSSLDNLSLPGLILFRTARTRDGLYTLVRLSDSGAVTAREMLGRFWTKFFGARFNTWDWDRPKTAWADLHSAFPRLSSGFQATLAALGRNLTRAIRYSEQLDETFWKNTPPLGRPLSGYLHMLLQNHDYSVAGYRQALAVIEQLAALAA